MKWYPDVELRTLSLSRNHQSCGARTMCQITNISTSIYSWRPSTNKDVSASTLHTHTMACAKMAEPALLLRRLSAGAPASLLPPTSAVSLFRPNYDAGGQAGRWRGADGHTIHFLQQSTKAPPPRAGCRLAGGGIGGDKMKKGPSSTCCSVI